MVAEYLSTVTNEKLRKTLTMYRLRDHSLAIETGRHRQTWLPREDRLCQLCPHRQVETETNFLMHCSKYEHVRAEFLSKVKHKVIDFDSLPDENKMQFILFFSFIDVVVVDVVVYYMFKLSVIFFLNTFLTYFYYCALFVNL